MAAPDRFPVPVSGTPIQKGWFARLVAFINSLVLHGDGRFTMVNRSAAGTTVTLTPSLINSLNRSAPAASGGASGVPNYAAGEAVTIGQQYTIASPGWIIGHVVVNFPAVSGSYSASWQIGLSIAGQAGKTIFLAVFARYDGAADTSSAFVSILIPACSFIVSSTSNLPSGALFSDLYAYPIL